MQDWASHNKPNPKTNGRTPFTPPEGPDLFAYDLN